ncbi:hypothetical protein ACWDNT_22660, partial [Streptomyces sp. NPDC000963]
MATFRATRTGTLNLQVRIGGDMALLRGPGRPDALLREIGRLREDIEIERGGISLDVPEQEI